MFRFSVRPAQITVGEGLRAAFDLLLRTWEVWLPVAVIVGIGQALLSAATSDVGQGPLIYVNRATNEAVVSPEFWSRLGGIALISVLVILVNLVGSWFFTATAVAGLRGRGLETGWVVLSGLKTVVAGLLLALGFGAGFLVLAIVIGTVPAIGLLGLLAALPIVIYLGIRFVFMELAIFDREVGPVDGLREAWRLSAGSVVRMFGWALVVMLIGIVVGWITAVPGAGLAATSPVLADGVAGAVNGVLACYGVYVLATLYESQRARLDPEYTPHAGTMPPEFDDPWNRPQPQ